MESATAPSAAAATPPRPIEKPIEIPEARPSRLGMYSWVITWIRPKVPTTQTPTNARATIPAVPPTAMKMETPVVSPYDGTVKAVHVAEGDRVAGGALLVELEE